MPSYLAKPRCSPIRPGHRLAPNRFAWPMLEPGPTSLRDATGGRRVGTLGAAAAWDKGAFGPCVRFNGTSNSGITFGPVTLGTTFWFATWARVDAIGGYRTLLTKDATQGLYYLGSTWNWYEVSDRYFSLPAIPDEWQHVALSVQDGVGTLYVDGRADPVVATGITSFAPNRMGCDPGDFLVGRLDSPMAAAGRSLSPADARALHRDHWAAFRPEAPDLRVSSAPVAAGGFQPAWGASVNTLLGGGC